MSTNTMIVQVHYCLLFLIPTLAPQACQRRICTAFRSTSRRRKAFVCTHFHTVAAVACALSMHCFQFRTQFLRPQAVLTGKLTAGKNLVFKTFRFVVHPWLSWLLFTIQSNAADTPSLHATTWMPVVPNIVQPSRWCDNFI